MKKNFKFMLVALFAFMGMNNAFAQSKPMAGNVITDDNYKYEVIANGNESTKTAELRITALNSPQTGNITITGHFTKVYDGVTWTLNVTRLGSEVFKNQTELTGVKFPAELQYIADKVFIGCTLLKTIEFEEGSQLRKIYTKAFATTQIDKANFSKCTQLQELEDYVFAEGGINMNSFVKEVTLPTSAMFTKLNKALANLTNLEKLNIKDTKITEIVANAFANDAKLKSMILPPTVKVIKNSAFEESSVEDLTIDLTSIEKVGEGGPVYGTTTVLKKLTFINPLKGTISANAFYGESLLGSDVTTYPGSDMIDMSTVTFGTTAHISTDAFGACDKIKKVKLGAIINNATSDYTIATKAFTGDNLNEVEFVGDITTNKAIDTKAFGEKLTKVTLLAIKAAGDDAGKFPIASQAFVFKTDADLTLTIGDILSTDATHPVMAATAFDMSALSKTAAIKIGAMMAKGKNYTKNAIKLAGTNNTTLEFTGYIEQKGLDVELIEGVAALKSITFDATIAEGGVKANVFKGIKGDYADGKQFALTFKGKLAAKAIEAGAFELADAAAGDGTKYCMVVKYDSEDHDNTFKEGMPFDQKTFNSSVVYGNLRDIKLTIKNAALAKTFAENQFDSPSKDIVYRIMMAPLAPENFFIVYGDNNNLGTSYARILMPAGKYKIDRRPTGKDADEVDQTGIVYTLYSVYKEEDDNSKLTSLNMLPMVSNDGFYYVNLTAPTVIIIKAQGTEKVNNKETKMWYETWDGVGTQSNKYDGDGSVKIATKIVTNEQLNDGTGNTGLEALTSAVLAANDVYLLSDPKNYAGVKAVKLDYSFPKPFINIGNFYALGKKYAGASRMIINWIGEENAATAIKSIKSATVDSDAIYNLAGQRVDASYKGVVIKNGQKYIQK